MRPRIPQMPLALADGHLPIAEIIQTVIDRGYVVKDDIRLIWGLSEAQYAELKDRLAHEKLIEPGSKHSGGFRARFNRKPDAADESAAPAFTFKADHERHAVARLTELLTHQDLENLLGNLVYALRRARQQASHEDRRGTKHELAVALALQHGIDLLAQPRVRELIAKRCKVKSPGRWHAGKATALRFTQDCDFPAEYAGIPAAESAPDFEYLEGRIDLAPLQDFQTEVQTKLRSVLATPNGRCIVTLPTGAGKTRVAVDTIRDWLTERYALTESGERNTVIWLAHTEELCEQAYACFRQVWHASSNVSPLLLFRFWGKYTHDLERHRDTLLTLQRQPTVFVSTPHRIVSLIENKLGNSDGILSTLHEYAGLIVVDEAHRAAAPSYRRIIHAFAAAPSEPAIVGLTATPFREEYSPIDPAAGTQELRKLFKSIIEPTRTLGDDARGKLQERGFLSTPVFRSIETNVILRAPSGIDMDAITDDVIEKIDHALKIRADKPERRMAVLADLALICRDPSSLVIYFGPSVQDAECMAFLLRQRGIEAAFVSGATRDVTRRKVIHDFKDKRIQVLCNCEVLTTGFDAPQVTHVVMARPTVSQVLYEQMIGRGLRGVKFGGTAQCHIVDLADKYRSDKPRLGYIKFRELWGRRNRRT